MFTRQQAMTTALFQFSPYEDKRRSRRQSTAVRVVLKLAIRKFSLAKYCEQLRNEIKLKFYFPSYTRQEYKTFSKMG